MLLPRAARLRPCVNAHRLRRNITSSPIRTWSSSPRCCCASHAPKDAKASTPKPPADHRVLAVQQDLFTTSIYSPGSPILLPNGARIFNRLIDFLRKQYVRYGFDEVITPTIYKKALWAKSGHLENYSEDMFTVTPTSLVRRDKSDTTRAAADNGEEAPAETEEDEYGLKPMNCPGHCLIFASKRRSYRDLPIRYADFSPLHRNEVSGALSGLTRVRRFHQDDGHIFCRPAQVEAEIRRTLDFVRVVYATFGLGPYRLALSTRPGGGQFIGDADDWDRAERSLTRALDASGQPWTVNPGDGAFYGPKIDIVLTDSDGKEHQTATIQLDFQLPKRFDLSYQAPAPEFERRGEPTSDPDRLAELGPVRPVMIHRAVLGSAERLMALLIEHYEGRWPFWLNPRQVMILTVNDSDPVVALAHSAQDVLLGRGGGGDVADDDMPLADPSGFAVDVDSSPRSLALKAREARAKGYSVLVTVGPRNVEAGTVSADMTGIARDRGSKGDALPESNAKREMTPAELLGVLAAQARAYR